MVQLSEPESSSGLSSRGHALTIGNEANEVFAILRDLWDKEKNPNGYVSLGVAENLLMHDKFAAYIEKNFTMPHRYLTYNDGGAGSRRLQSAIAKFLTRYLKPVQPIKPEHVVATNGCSAAIEHCSYLLADPGDVFLLGRPYYRAFIPDMQLRFGAKVVPVSFGDTDPMGLECVKHYERVIEECQARSEKVKGIMLCHPHNPLGRCYSKEVMVELMKLCQKHQMHLVSDEIYAMSVWENKEDTDPAPVPFVSAASIDTTGLIDPHLVHLIWGMSKDFGANGFRLGCMISQNNPDLMKALGPLSLYSYVSGPADHITATFLEDEEFTDAYLRENSEKLSQKYSTAVRYLNKHGIRHARGANAAFFIVADLGSVYRANSSEPVADDELTHVIYKKLLKNKVFLVESDAMGSEKPGWFRIVFTASDEYLLEGLSRVVATVGTSDSK